MPDARKTDMRFAIALSASLTVNLACGEESNPGHDAGAGGAGGAVEAGRSDGMSDATPVQGCPTDTGFPADDACLEPPAPGTGIQLHYGPARYDDPAEIAQYVLEPDQEITDCYYMKAPNTEDLYFNSHRVSRRPSAGPTFLLIVDAPDHADGLGPCGDGDGAGSISFGARSDQLEIPDPALDVPENAGLYSRLPAATQLVQQLHFYNETAQPMLREQWVNIMAMDPASATEQVGSMWFIGGLGLNVAPGTRTVVRGGAVAPHDLRIFTLVGHFHPHTQRFTAWKVTPPFSDGGSVGPCGEMAGGTRTLLREAYDSREPGNIWFDSVHQNPPPDPATRTAGGFTGLLELRQGDRIEWECEVVNDGPGDTTALTFSNDLYRGEMCNVFGGYVPSADGMPWPAACP